MELGLSVWHIGNCADHVNAYDSQASTETRTFEKPLGHLVYGLRDVLIERSKARVVVRKDRA